MTLGADHHVNLEEVAGLGPDLIVAVNLYIEQPDHEDLVQLAFSEVRRSPRRGAAGERVPARALDLLVERLAADGLASRTAARRDEARRVLEATEHAGLSATCQRDGGGSSNLTRARSSPWSSKWAARMASSGATWV